MGATDLSTGADLAEIERLELGSAIESAGSNPQSPGRLEGRLDSTSWTSIHGWVCWPADPQRRAVVEVVYKGDVVQRVRADMARADVFEAGYGDGNYGFKIVIPKQAFAEPTVLLSVREASSGLDLAGSPFALQNDAPTLSWVQGAITRVQDDLIAAEDREALFAFGSYLLGAFDRVGGAHASLSKSVEHRLERWTEKLGNAGMSDAVQGLLSVARHQYGDKVLSLPTSDRPRVSVVIPVHGKFWYTYQCLVSIQEFRPSCSYEVIVVDDGSTDETLFAALLLEGVRIIRKNSDRGFVASVNQGVAAARGDYVLLLNNDTQVTHGWLDEMLDTIERDPAIGVVGSKLIFPTGRLQEAGGLIWSQANGYNIGRDGDPDDPEYCFMRDADYVSGACLLISRRLWDDVGGLSDEFKPAYYEDTDLCFKVRRAGYRVVVQPYSKIIHHEGVSSGTDVQGTGMKRFQAVNQLKFSRRWANVLSQHPNMGSDPLDDDRFVGGRVLFIDETAPMPDRDAGSNAAFEHILSLQRCGYQVHFVSAHNMARIPLYTEALERRGVRCYYAPYTWSVEELLRKNAKRFDAVYIHRLSNARKYLSIVREMLPAARILYNVADLHYVRKLREASFDADEAGGEKAAALKAAELSVIREADVVITHSSFERDELQQEAPGVEVCLIPWTVEPRPTPKPFEQRAGVAFVGSYNHVPNQDAVHWLLREVMPLVWRTHPAIKVTVFGSGMDKLQLDAAGGPVELRGWVRDIVAELHHQRLTVAPLRYGAGLKGKVLTSFAAGIPCAGTTIAAEGAGLPPSLSQWFADGPQALANAILALHSDPFANDQAARDGVAYIERTCSRAVIDGLIRAAVSPKPANANQLASSGG